MSSTTTIGSMTTIVDIEQAIKAVQSDSMDDVIDARTFAEYLGENSLQSNEDMPLAFAHHPVLVDGFEEGLANAKCVRELIRHGML